MQKKAKIFIVAIALIAIIGVGVTMLRPRSFGAGNVIVLCGGSMRAVLEESIERYEKFSDDTITPTYGGSGELCAQIQQVGRGDIYICHDPFMPWAEERGLITEWETMGYLDVVIITPAGNPHDIESLKDLAQEGLRIGIGDKIYSTSGNIVKNIFSNAPFSAGIEKNVRAETKGHQQRCNDVIMGTLDAGLVWEPVARLYQDRLEIIPIDRQYIDTVTSATYGESDLRNVKVTVGITSNGDSKQAAHRFYDFLVNQCQDIFKEHGFRMSPIESS